MMFKIKKTFKVCFVLLSIILFASCDMLTSLLGNISSGDENSSGVSTNASGDLEYNFERHSKIVNIGHLITENDFNKAVNSSEYVLVSYMRGGQDATSTNTSWSIEQLARENYGNVKFYDALAAMHYYTCDTATLPYDGILKKYSKNDVDLVDAVLYGKYDNVNIADIICPDLLKIDGDYIVWLMNYLNEIKSSDNLFMGGDTSDGGTFIFKKYNELAKTGAKPWFTDWAGMDFPILLLFKNGKVVDVMAINQNWILPGSEADPIKAEATGFTKTEIRQFIDKHIPSAINKVPKGYTQITQDCTPDLGEVTNYGMSHTVVPTKINVPNWFFGRFDRYEISSFSYPNDSDSFTAMPDFYSSFDLNNFDGASQYLYMYDTLNFWTDERKSYFSNNVLNKLYDSWQDTDWYSKNLIEWIDNEADSSLSTTDGYWEDNIVWFDPYELKENNGSDANINYHSTDKKCNGFNKFTGAQRRRLEEWFVRTYHYSKFTGYSDRIIGDSPSYARRLYGSSRQLMAKWGSSNASHKSYIIDAGENFVTVAHELSDDSRPSYIVVFMKNGIVKDKKYTYSPNSDNYLYFGSAKSDYIYDMYFYRRTYLCLNFTFESFYLFSPIKTFNYKQILKLSRGEEIDFTPKTTYN